MFAVQRDDLMNINDESPWQDDLSQGSDIVNLTED